MPTTRKFFVTKQMSRTILGSGGFFVVIASRTP